MTSENLLRQLGCRSGTVRAKVLALSHSYGKLSMAAATSLEVHLHVIRQALRDMVLQEKSWLNRKVVKICKVCGPLLLLTLRPPPGCCGVLKKHSTPHTRVNLR